MILIPVSHWYNRFLYVSKPAQLAADLADCSESKFRIGAVIADKKDRILGMGFNSLKTHPIFGSKPGYQTLHAEGAAMYSVSKMGNIDLLEGSIMYVYRHNHQMAKPCVHCQKLIANYGIKEVYYSEKNNDWY